uniref:carbohydrate ABC transporter permease n=1 Tax=uncultured Subdoligranulum sp. TaxID=512298 RepID=UPI002607A040
SVLFHVFSCLLGFIMIYPLLWLLASSFKSNDTMFHNTYSLIPETWDVVQNYLSGLAGVAGYSFMHFFKNSVIVTLVSVVTSIFSSLLAAYALARVKFRGSGFWFGCVIMTMMIPSQVMVVPQYIILRALHLNDTLAAMVLPWCFGYAFFIFLIVQYMRGVPKELDEAAQIDGCSKIGILFRILVPVVQPAIVSASIFAFYWIWQDFFQPLIFVGSPKNFTIPLALNMYTDPNSFNNYGGLFAMSVVSLIPVIVVFIIFQKYLVEGIATDGIKG